MINKITEYLNMIYKLEQKDMYTTSVECILIKHRLKTPIKIKLILGQKRIISRNPRVCVLGP